MLILTRADVTAVLDMGELIDAVESAMVDLSAGRASVPPRIAARVEERDGMLAAMPAFLPSSGALVTKLVSVFPQNTDRPTHQAVICCFDPDTGSPIALMDGTLLTALRTAAGSAAATRRLARADAQAVALIGTGVQAEAHLQALRTIGFGRFAVAGRDRDKADAFATTHGIDAAESIEEAVRGADVVCATTHAPAPVIAREWIRPGTHLCSVGYNTGGSGELDLDTIRDALVVVESRDAALAPPPAGAVELLRARKQGVLPEPVAEIGECPSRTDDAQITVYKSVGVAVQDAAAATLVLSAARAQGRGIDLDLS